MGDTLQRFALAVILVGGFLHVEAAVSRVSYPLIPGGLMLLGLVIFLSEGLAILFTPPQDQ